MRDKSVALSKILVVLILVAILYGATVFSAIHYYKTAAIDVTRLVLWISSGVAIVTGILAMFKDLLVDFIKAPKLNLLILPDDRRDCHTTSFTDLATGQFQASTHFFRLRVQNIGPSVAESVEVNLERVKTYTEGRFELDQGIVPLRFMWSHWGEKRFEISIPSGTYRHCDLGFIIDPSAPLPPLEPSLDGKVRFWLDVWPRPNVGRTYLLPGRYQIVISAFGKNTKPANLTLEVGWKGLWHSDIAQTLSEDFSIKVIKK
jgi:hypothetical protein